MRYSRRPTALAGLKLEGDAKKAMTEVREKIGVREDGDFYDLDASPWATIRDDFPALASLSDEELRARLSGQKSTPPRLLNGALTNSFTTQAAIVAPGDPLDILVKTPLLPLLAVNLAVIAARSQFGGLCGTLLADPSCRL